MRLAVAINGQWSIINGQWSMTKIPQYFLNTCKDVDEYITT